MTDTILRTAYPRTWAHLWLTQIVEKGHDTDPQHTAKDICNSVKSFSLSDLTHMINNDYEPDCLSDQREKAELIAVFESEGGRVYVS